MAHISYKTEALVLESIDRGEANKTCILLTPDLGLVYAHAQGVRLEKSKLRYSLEDYSLTEVILVHGKSGWRIVGAELILNTYESVQKKSFMVIARMFSLVKKLVAGQEPNPDLYNTCRDAVTTLWKTKHDQNKISRLEIVWALKVLFVLGYVDISDGLANSIKTDMSDVLLDEEVDNIKKEAVRQINRAIKSSQLIF